MLYVKCVLVDIKDYITHDTRKNQKIAPLSFENICDEPYT